MKRAIFSPKSPNQTSIMFNNAQGVLNMVTKIQRLPMLQSEVGLSRSSVYGHIAKGLLPKPIQISSRAVAWLSHETDAIIAARIAGKSDDEIRELVTELMSQRSKIQIQTIGGV